MNMRSVGFLGLISAGVVLWGDAGKADGPPLSSLNPLDLKPLTIAPTASATPRPTPQLAVVPYEKLLPFLPEPPAGWTAENPSGSTADIEVFYLSTATRTYQKGDDENAAVATVSILDAGGYKGYFETTTRSWKFTNTSPDGYDKAVEIDGMPGYEHFSKAANSGSLCVIVGKRFFVQIEITRQDPKELREWLKKLDLKKLAELR